MAEQTSDGMYEGLYGQKFVNETEADGSKADWNAQNYGGSNTYLNDFANSAAGKGLGNLLGVLGVALAILVLPMYYVPNFIVTVLADFGIMASFWPMFFIVWIPVLALIIWVMIKSSPSARILILALIIIPIMGTIGILQLVKVIGGENADYPYEWYVKALSEKQAEKRAEKNLYKVALTTQGVTRIYAEPSQKSTVLKEIPINTFITLTYKRSPVRNMESVECQGTEGWIYTYYVKEVETPVVRRLKNDRTITIKKDKYIYAETTDPYTKIKRIKAGQRVTVVGESKAEIVHNDKTRWDFVKVEQNGDIGWFNITKDIVW